MLLVNKKSFNLLLGVVFNVFFLTNFVNNDKICWEKSHKCCFYIVNFTNFTKVLEMFVKFLIPQRKNKKTLFSVLVVFGPTKVHL